jgi:hypothetical protein
MKGQNGVKGFLEFKLTTMKIVGSKSLVLIFDLNLESTVFRVYFKK